MKTYIKIAPQAEFVQLTYKKTPVTTAKVEKRGVVKAFSYKSRSRLNAKIAQLKRHVMPYFVTLTYHEVYPSNFEEYKYHVHRFLIALSRKFGSYVINDKGVRTWRTSVSCIWKLEFQERGAPHFHLLVFGADYAGLADFVPLEWNKIAGYGSDLHLLWHKGQLGNGNKHCVQFIRSWNGVKWYASKYLCKLDDKVGLPGRFWGVRGDLPLSQILTFRMDVSAALEFRRVFVRLNGVRLRRFGFWGYVGNMSEYLRLIDWLMDNFTDYHLPGVPPDDLPLRYDVTPSRFLTDLTFSIF